MMRVLCRKALPLFLLITLSVWSANAIAAVTVELIGQVTDASGPRAGEFITGDTVRITIKVDEAVVDIKPDIKEGAYPPASLMELKTNFESAGHVFITKGGAGVYAGVTVYNDSTHPDQVFSDQLAYFGWDLISGSLDGDSLLAMEVGFTEYTDGIVPTMLVNDGIPTSLFSYRGDNYVFLKFDTDTDWTHIQFRECHLIDTDNNNLLDSCDSDNDNDGIPNSVDSCPNVYNPFPRDTDGDGIDDACDNDADGDGFTQGVDCNDYNANINPDVCDIRWDGVDQDCDGTDRLIGRPCYFRR
jgi:Thrombospondin type 3 repeat/Putative metal-binding motif